MYKSSTFPRLSSVAISGQNGTVTVPVKHDVKHKGVFSWICVSLVCFIVGSLGITNTMTFYLVSLKCRSPSYPIQNISVQMGTKFTLAYLNDKSIEYCSVRPPFFKYEFHDSKYSNLMTREIIDNGRIDIIVINRWCKVVIKSASFRDEGKWELFIDARDGRSERKYQLYNVSIKEKVVPLKRLDDRSMNTNPTIFVWKEKY